MHTALHSTDHSRPAARFIATIQQGPKAIDTKINHSISTCLAPYCACLMVPRRSPTPRLKTSLRQSLAVAAAHTHRCTRLVASPCRAQSPSRRALLSWTSTSRNRRAARRTSRANRRRRRQERQRRPSRMVRQMLSDAVALRDCPSQCMSVQLSCANCASVAIDLQHTRTAHWCGLRLLWLWLTHSALLPAVIRIRCFRARSGAAAAAHQAHGTEERR